jgi:radical SAM/Cys-rich protein
MPKRFLTLLRGGKPLSDPALQRRVLWGRESAQCRGLSFGERVLAVAGNRLQASDIEILQLNLGKLCNQTCRHCHVDAGPDRREIMTRETAEACLRVLSDHPIQTLDLTGGAPELNPNFRWLVAAARRLDRRVIDRCNLTILLAPGFTDLPEFLAEQRVEIVASLPCYLERNCDAQRGPGVFEQSIAALRRLNQLGYGDSRTGLSLTLVYNPVGPSLPPAQEKLEAEYRRELRARFGVEFTRLFAIANMPISRFLDELIESGQYEAYLATLVDAFNPATVAGLMCRNTLSVDWRGYVYDCDFNQMLDWPVAEGWPRHIRDFGGARWAGRPIATGPHCFGCTAGPGSSCQGAIETRGI